MPDARCQLFGPETLGFCRRQREDLPCEHRVSATRRDRGGGIAALDLDGRICLEGRALERGARPHVLGSAARRCHAGGDAREDVEAVVAATSIESRGGVRNKHGRGLGVAKTAPVTGSEPVAFADKRPLAASGNHIPTAP